MFRPAADLHTHTVASTHAYSTVTENCRAAHELGLAAVAMTDHAPGMPDAPHVWHFVNLKVLPRKICGVYLLKGIEADITDYKGNLDVSDDLLSTLEWTVVSLHSQAIAPGSIEDHTAAYLGVCENKWVDVIGHPTTTKYRFDMEKCVKCFKESGKLIEINESSIISGKSKPETVLELLRICKRYEAPIVVDTDAHYCGLIGRTDNATALLEAAGFPEKLIYNSEWERIREHIIKKHGDIGL